MKPASVAKLALRLSSACLLLYLVPLYLGEMGRMGFQFAVTGDDGGLARASWLLLFGMRVIAISILAIAFWFKANTLSAFFLPKGVSTDQDDTYPAAQRIGLMFVGVFVLYEGMRNLMHWLGSDYISLVFCAFEFLMAIILIVGLNDLTGIIRRILRTNWWRVLMRLRAKL